MARFYKVPYDGDSDWSEWQTPVQNYKMSCCDCGLVHDVQWTVLKVTDSSPNGKNFNADELPWGEYRIGLRVRRNNRSTAQIRRHKK